MAKEIDPGTERYRFRSFAERYLLTRTATFAGTDAQIQAQGWEAILQAKSLYKKIDAVATEFTIRGDAS